MCHRSGSQMRCKAALILLLAILVCHAFSAAHGKFYLRKLSIRRKNIHRVCVLICILSIPSYAAIRQPDDWHQILRKECKLSVCHEIGGHKSCFCCLATPDSPCWFKEDECKKACSQVQLPPSSSAGTNRQIVS